MMAKEGMLAQRKDIFSFKDWKKETSPKVAEVFHTGLEFLGRVEYDIITLQ